MPAQFDLVVFDWDGTLLDSAAAIVHAIQRACEDLGLETPDERTARSVIGLGLVDALARVVPDLPSSRHQELAGRYRYHYLSRDHELTLFDGVPALLDDLSARGHTLAVATGKSRAGLDRALGHTGLGSRFAATRCADESVSKPAPDMVLELMDELSFDPARTLVIGDTTHDLLMARNAGCESVAVTYGAHPLHELLAASPKAHCASVDELTAWLACHAQRCASRPNWWTAGPACGSRSSSAARLQPHSRSDFAGRCVATSIAAPMCRQSLTGITASSSTTQSYT